MGRRAITSLVTIARADTMAVSVLLLRFRLRVLVAMRLLLQLLSRCRLPLLLLVPVFLRVRCLWRVLRGTVARAIPITLTMAIPFRNSCGYGYYCRFVLRFVVYHLQFIIYSLWHHATLLLGYIPRFTAHFGELLYSTRRIRLRFLSF